MSESLKEVGSKHAVAERRAVYQRSSQCTGLEVLVWLLSSKTSRRPVWQECNGGKRRVVGKSRQTGHLGSCRLGRELGCYVECDGRPLRGSE